MSFFDDEGVPDEAKPPRPRRPKKDHGRLRIQRLLVFLALLFAVVFLIALGVRSCQKHAKESSYRTYFSAVQTMITDSNKAGQELAAILDNPLKDGRRDLTTKLDRLVQRNQEIADRAQRTEPPGRLADQHSVFVLGMRVRTQGVKLVRDGLLAALSSKNPEAVAPKLAMLAGYFSGPDVYYRELYQTQAQKTMVGDGVTNVAVPVSEWYLKHDILDRAQLETALKRAQSSTGAAGTHGVNLVSVVVKPANVELNAGVDNKVNSSAEIAFAVTVQNQGSATENDVPVEVTYQPPGNGDVQKATQTISSIGPGEKQTVEVTGIIPPAEAIGRPSTLKVKAGPVKNEQVATNNEASYTVILQIK